MAIHPTIDGTICARLRIRKICGIENLKEMYAGIRESSARTAHFVPRLRSTIGLFILVGIRQPWKPPPLMMKLPKDIMVNSGDRIENLRCYTGPYGKSEIARQGPDGDRRKTNP